MPPSGASVREHINQVGAGGGSFPLWGFLLKRGCRSVGSQGGENLAGACGDAAFLAAARRIKASLLLRTIIEMLSAAKDESVPPLAAYLLSENSRPGFGGCDSELRRVIELPTVLNASGLAASLYDDRIGPRDTGKERDSRSGLDYFGARRLTSPDWSETPQPVT
jgi:hypothetical protein